MLEFGSCMIVCMERLAGEFTTYVLQARGSGQVQLLGVLELCMAACILADVMTNILHGAMLMPIAWCKVEQM